MAVTVSFSWNKTIQQITKEATKGDETALFMAKTWHRLYDQFVPMDTGTLAHDAVDYTVENGVGFIHHKAPYAHRMYNGAGFNFSGEKHPLATAHWDKVANQVGKGEQLIKDTQAFIKGGV